MSHRPYRLLAVDDEPLSLKLVTNAFATESDIEVLSTTSALRALEIAQLSDIDLVITDQRMPEMTGMQFLSRLRELRPHALRILLTAFPDTAVALKAINEGLVYRFVLKPWDPEEMRVTVRRALETKRLSDEHDRLVTQLKKSHDELARAEHMGALGRLAAGIGHELGTVVSGLLQKLSELESALRQSTGGPAPVKESLAAIRAGAQQLDALAKGMNSYAQAGDPEPVDVNQAVLAAVQLVAHRFRDRIRLDRELSAVPRVRCRPADITQVAVNLLTNAADAVERVEHAAVCVRTSQEDDHVRLEVSDNGKGFDPAIANRLFQPFTSTKPGRGAGLGLSICRSLVERCGGTIEGRSEKGQGVRFVVTLPAMR